MIIKQGIVTNFNGSITIYCTKAGEQQSHTFAMIGDDPDPSVAADGSFAWEATSGYGFDKLKFDGVAKGGRVTGKMVAESRPLIQGTEPGLRPPAAGARVLLRRPRVHADEGLGNVGPGGRVRCGFPRAKPAA